MSSENPTHILYQYPTHTLDSLESSVGLFFRSTP